MTITNNPSRDEYTATAGQVVFNYTFKIFNGDELDVYVTPSGQTPDDSADLTTDYAVDTATVGSEDGGFITFNTPLAAGDAVTIVSGIPYDRTVDYQQNGDFLPVTVNNDNDRQVAQIKQVLELARKAVVFGQSSQNTSGLTSESPVAKNFIRWKDDLSGFENIPILELPSGTVPADGVAYIFDTVAALKASGAEAGYTVSTSGYYSPGDGGGATYLVVAPQSVDGYGDHTLANGNAAILQYDRGVIDIGKFGAKADGVSDDLPSFLAAKAALDANNGGTIRAMGDSYGVDGELLLDTCNIVIEGKGSGFHHDTSGASPVTKLLKIGTSLTPVVNITSASTFKASGSGLRGICVDGNIVANVGILIKSHNKVVLQDVVVRSALSINIHFTVKTGMSEAADNQYGQVDGLYAICGYPVSGTLADNAEGMVFDGDSVANTSLNLFKNLVALHVNAIGFRLANCDNNEFQNMRSVRFVAPTGSNNGLIFGGGDSESETARGNIVSGLSSREVLAEGTTTKPFASYNNRILFDRENFATVPAVDTGATLIWKSELMPSGENVIQHDNGWYEVWGLATNVGIASAVTVDLPFSFDSTAQMQVSTTIRTGFTGAGLGSPGGFPSAVNQITIANNDQSVALDVAWRVIGKKTS